MVTLENAAIEHAVLIRARPEEVYETLTSAQGWDAWFTTSCEVDARPGGGIRLRWVAWGPDKITSEDGGPVLEAKRPRRFVFQWHPDNESYFTTVELNLESVPEGTVLRLEERGYQDTPEALRAMLACAAGWGEALTLLKFYLEGKGTY